MKDLKESKQALAAEVIVGLEGFAPPTLLSMASRMNWSTRLFNLIVTNVPGPQFPLYLRGRELLEGQVLEPDELDVEPKTTGRQVGEHERPVRLAQRGEGFGKRL